MGMLTDLLQRLGFDLTDTLARHPEFLADLLERVRNPVLKPEPDTQNLLLTRSQFA